MTNVHDACIFPQMSRAVSNIQASHFNCRLLRGEELHSAVQKVWHDRHNLLAMSRAFAANHQIVCAILHYKGGNKYLSDRGGLHYYGIRRTYIAESNGMGVVPVDMVATNESESRIGLFHSISSVYGLKYRIPNISELTEAQLTQEMCDVLAEYVDTRGFDEELQHAWNQDVISKTLS